MRKSIWNLYYAATAQTRRIEFDDATGKVWIAACLGCLVLLSISEHPPLAAIPASASMAATCFNVFGLARISHQKLCIAILGSLIPLTIARFGQAPVFVVMALTYLHIRSVADVLLEMPSPAQTKPESDAEDEDEANALRNLCANPRAVLVAVGPIIGTFQGISIPAWFMDDQGRTHEFIATYTGQMPIFLKGNESLISPGLIYRISTSTPTCEANES